MRYDDDHSQSFGPVLRRIAILAVIITAVPVMLWSITAFMRTFVAQPVIPSARPLASADIANATPAPVAASNPQAPASAPVVEAKATTSDADGKSGPLSDPAASSTLPATNPAVVASTDTTGSTPATPAAPQARDQSAANSPWPNPAQAVGEQQLQSGAPTVDSGDTLPASPPLTGPIPLPPHRPKMLALAEGPIPLPRKRPTDADTASNTPPADNSNFLTHLFGQTH
jgi:hypothetical protein